MPFFHFFFSPSSQIYYINYIHFSTNTTTQTKMAPPPPTNTKALGRAHECLDAEKDARCEKIGKSLWWYGPKYAPHDVPKFYDVSGIVERPEVFKTVVEVLSERYKNYNERERNNNNKDSSDDKKPITHVAGFDARGFLFGPAIAMELNVPFVMIRKAGKLPGVLVSSGEYITEYSKDETVMRLGAIKKGDRVVLIDDLIATGGTAIAGFDLVDQLGAEVHEFAAIVELPFLEGVKKIHEHRGGKFKDVSCFTVVDCATIREDMGRDPEEGVPRVVSAEDAREMKYIADDDNRVHIRR